MTTTTISEFRNVDVPLAFSKIGPYCLGKEIGRGATGILYEATHVEQSRKVVLKLLDPRLVGGQKASRQDHLFAREAMILAKISRHPGIIGVLDAGSGEGLPYIVMEHIEGRPLSLALQFRKTDLKGLVRILRDVALAVHHAHEHNILHRNLKPSNVLLDENEQAHITDFGVAKIIDPHANQSTTYTVAGPVGTPSYMSPEQAAGLKAIDRRTDVYSLGAMLYEIMTGRPPFTVGHSVLDLVNIVRGDIKPPSKLKPEGGATGGDAALEKICMTALANAPKDRHATAKVFAAALTEWLGETSARKEPAIPSRKTIAGFCLAIGLVVAAALAYTTIFS